MTLYQSPPGQTSINPHVEIYGPPLKSVKNFTFLGSTVASYNTYNLSTPLMWTLTTVSKLPLESLEVSGCMYGHNVVLQSPHSARCTRQLCFQHYCTQQRYTFSTVATLDNFPKCTSDIYDKSCGYHGKTTFQTLKY